MRRSTMKRTVCALLAALMMLSVFPATALFAAADGEEQGDDIPVFDETFDDDAVGVSSAAQLESALAAQSGAIRIDADFSLDRTFYVTADTVIYSTSARVLTRAADFAGDIFVVGESADGACETPVRLSLGSPISDTPDLLVIDGNKGGMNVEVNGSAIFVVNGMNTDLYAGVTVRNCEKTANAKTSQKEDYGVSYPDKIGGPAMIVCKSAKVNILGAKFTGNASKSYSSADETSSQGGAIYNFGTTNIYGGTFENNYGGRGGVFFNYRTMHIYRAEIRSNTSGDAGGVMYMPNSTGAYTYIGEENDRVLPEVIIDGNTSGSYGGAIYANNLLNVNNAVFSNNTNSASTGGAIFSSGMRVTVQNSDFVGNSAANNGGAIYSTGNNGREDIPELTLSNVSFRGNTAASKGGAVYLNGARAYVTGSEFIENTAKYGGAISAASGGTLEVTETEFTDNAASSTGGALMSDASTVVLNEVTGEGNSASGGGFLLNDADSVVTVYHSTFTGNTSSKLGGAFSLQAGAVTRVYDTAFTGNSAGTNGGAVGVYTDGAETVVQNCTFTGNRADDGFGGAIHVSTRGHLKFYSSTATDNTAKQGGFLYETVTNSAVYLAGATVSGNSATAGGPIIWGNSVGAKLYIDKAKYTDEDLVGDYDDDYWAAAIVNSLNVIESTLVIPSYTDYDGSTISPGGPAIDPNVYTAIQLSRAIAAGLPVVTVAADFTIDRTIYIPGEVVIRSDEAHTITRAPGFAGDMFVVGEMAQGIKTEGAACLTVGDPSSQENDLLIIDGNKDNMTVDVTGTVFYVVTDSTLRLYPNATVRNCMKVGNAKTSVNGYSVSYPEKVGGSVAILTNKSFMEMYGGRITGNGVNTANVNGAEICFQGGAIYNYGTLDIYGGVISDNTAKSGGAIFNYRRLHIYGGSLTGNYAAESGGAIYMPNSGSSFTYIGEASENAVGAPVFENNSADRYGGAIYARNVISAQNAVFRGNTAATYSGGAIAAFNIDLSLEGCSFEDNTAGKYGGALYINDDEPRPQVKIISCTFDGSSSGDNGGALYLNGADVKAVAAVFTGNESSVSGGAIYMTGSSFDLNGGVMSGNSASSYGGAIYPNTSSVATINNITAENNSASGGGFAYTKNSELLIYNSRIGGNSASTGGAIGIQAGTDTKVFNTVFENNTASANAGAIAAYSNEGPILFHSCTFSGNSAPDGFGGAIHVTSKGNLTAYNTTASGNSAKQGGFMYETLSGSVVTIVGLTVSGNSATGGGPIIWGNTVNAVLNIDKSQHTDAAVEGPYGADYWAEAIKNKLTVNDISAQIPSYLDYGNEPYDNMSDAVDVSSSSELEAAIEAGCPHIRVVADFNIDRTFYITGETTIFSTIEHVLTRDPAFGGEIFVIGETSGGDSALLLGSNTKLTLGNPASVTENLLIIDGNDGNMTVDVVGSVVFIVNGADAAFYPNLTVRNCYKAANEKSFTDSYRLGTPPRVGGAVGVISYGILEIFGGNYINNRVNEEAAVDAETGETPNCASNGGCFYNSGDLRIYGGYFANNEGARGGVIYTLRVTHIYGGVFENNHSFTSGGVVYLPSSAVSHLIIGTRAGSSRAVFTGNYSDGNGGCLQISALGAVVICGNTDFIGNHGQGGGAICAYGSLSIFSTVFRDNYSTSRGGAIYLSNQKEEEVTRVVNVVDSVFENNISCRGGAISVYASSVDYPEGGIATVSGCTFTGNRAQNVTGTSSTVGGGAVHLDRKGRITVENSTFTNNSSDDEAGAFYATGKSVVTLKDTAITGSSSAGQAGAISLHSAELYMDDSTISGCSSGNNGGAVYVSYSSAWDVNSYAKITGSIIENNTAVNYGAGIYATRQTVENDVRILDIRSTTFRGNSVQKSGGAMYILANVKGYLADDVFENNGAQSDGGAIGSYGVVEMDMLTFTGNTAGKTGGALSLQSGAVTRIYSTVFTGNVAGTNGGAAVVTSGGGETVFHTCTFTGNSAELGGGVYATGGSAVNVYSTTGTDNSADKGGFLYITTTGTVFTLAGAEVSGNSASVGGPIIWGNSNGAVLNIDKAKWNDSDASGEYDADYWSAAIVNLLSVNEVTESIPAHTTYSGSGDKTPPSPTVYPVVPVTDVFDLSQSSSDGFIDSVYDQFERLDNSSNFMSTAVTVFEDINGEDVTVDSYVYKTNTTTENMNVGVGLMVYQAMRYKEAHPEEEVYIDLSAYRFSVQTGVNINRNSRYFGYVRQMKGVEYDEFGFVRIAYLLVSAAKMGIHVNAIGHLDAYPISGAHMVEYFENHVDMPCDPSYVTGGKVGDYLTFTFCNWTLDGKGGTDMMHTKLCAVSHYLDMNGEVHRNAVWTSSSNFDGTTAKGYNANWKLQTATIISDHAEIYRMSVNYLRLIAAYCGQEEAYIFQDLVNEMNAEQAKLLTEGRGNEIPADEQILYLGTPEDDVFELYFTPLGGGVLDWNELCNPYCKYIRKLYDSEDYIRFAMSIAEYSHSTAMHRSLEEIVAAAFHNNKNPENAIYVVADEYPAEAYDDLVVGVDIGYKFFHDNNAQGPFNFVHNKDYLFSYVENGQRYYVSLLNSLNVHSGSMYYQSNQIVIIKEKTCSSNSVFSIMSKGFTTAEMVTHSYGDLETYTAANESEHTYTYRACAVCGEIEVEQIFHNAGQWHTVRRPQIDQKGIEECRCTACSQLMGAREIAYDPEEAVVVTAVVANGAAALPADAPDEIGTVYIPKEATNLEAVFASGRSIGAIVLKGTDLDSASIEAICSAAPLTVYCNRLQNGGGAAEALADAEGVTVRDILGTAKDVLYFLRDDGSNAVAVIGTIAVDDLDYDSLTLTATFSRDGADRVFETQVTRVYKSVKNVASTLESVALATSLYRVDGAEYIYVMNVNGVPDGEYTLSVELTSQIGGTVVEGRGFEGRAISVPGESVSYTPPAENAGIVFADEGAGYIPDATVKKIGTLSGAPLTFEAVYLLPRSFADRAGVLIGNYTGKSEDQINLEVYTDGQARLWFKTDGTSYTTLFKSDIRSDDARHLALTVDGTTAALYLDGVLAETATLKAELPAVTQNFCVGGDNRTGNTQAFRGVIYGVNLFDVVRTPDEIAVDAIFVTSDADRLVYSEYYTG